MRLLMLGNNDELLLTEYFYEDSPHYAILSHTWGPDSEEVTFNDLKTNSGRGKAGYEKLLACARQARKDGLIYSWVDTCCIDKNNNNELSEAITSMYRWYHNAVECYVYLRDVPDREQDVFDEKIWESKFCKSRWFKRGWTLQELIAPKSVKFYSASHQYLGDKKSLEMLIHNTSNIPTAVLCGASLNEYSIEERLGWAKGRSTKRKEDGAYCLLGIFGIFMPLLYGEGENAFVRLQDQIKAISQNNQGMSRVKTAMFPTRPSSDADVDDNGSLILGAQGLESLSAHDQLLVAQVVIDNCRQACFELYQTNSLSRTKFHSMESHALPKLFNTPDGKFPATYKDFELAQWIAKIYHALSRINQHDSLQPSAISDPRGFGILRDQIAKLPSLITPWGRLNTSFFETAVQTAIALCRHFNSWDPTARLEELVAVLDGKSNTTFSTLLPPGADPPQSTIR